MKKIAFTLLILAGLNGSLMATRTNPVPFSTDSTHLTIWNGTDYEPFFIKGVNLGVAVPGTFPGEMAATREDYSRWFTMIQEAGFNCIRLYTLHFPRFYEVLDSFNTSHPSSPLYFMQGVWLEEEYPGYSNDLYFLNNPFKVEIEENTDCVFGNRTIPARQGKAYGTYTTDASKWCMAFLVGREVYGDEVLTTDRMNPGVHQFSGKHFSIANATPTETWFTSMLDYSVDYMKTRYGMQLPVSSSSWPTLDPMVHPEEVNRSEDSATIDLSKIQRINAPAGYFISYHAYPYYPDFVGAQKSYQSYSDDYGPNSYLGYLNDLKAHYPNVPLIIAEYGVPSSWAIAHYTSSGMNHGGFDEYNQGLTDIRLLESIRTSGCGGGIQFSWIDEWFKKTWITDPIDYRPESRILYQNVSAAEQNFGLVSYEKTVQKDTLIPFKVGQNISYLNSSVDYSFFNLEVGLKSPMDLPGEMWIALDTYSSQLGESKLPTGETIPSRSEFALHLTNYAAELYVTQAYDIFGIWHRFSEPTQLYHSIPTDGAPWNIVRVRNNSSFSEVQYIGNLQVNKGTQPVSSKDAVTIYDQKISIKIPWFYLNVVGPDQRYVFNDYRSTTAKEDTVSDGFLPSVYYKQNWYVPSKRFAWEPWNRVPSAASMEKKKTSYYVMKEELPLFNTPAIAVRDSFKFIGPNFPVTVQATDGLLKNDFDLDGNSKASLITSNPVNGRIYLDNDGSFMYQPNGGFVGYDSLTYCVFDGLSLSKSNTVVINVVKNSSKVDDNQLIPEELMLTPNPATDFVQVESPYRMRELQLFGTDGKLLQSKRLDSYTFTLPVSNLSQGLFMIVVRTNQGILSGRLLLK
jgi:hypothetical protein